MTSAKLARTSRSPGSPSTTPGALLSLASNATWSGPTSSGRTSARVMMGPPTPSSFSSSTSSLTRVNSTNVLNEGLRIGEIGRQMNSKVRLVEIGVYRK
jgi:hypothetical protein